MRVVVRWMALGLALIGCAELTELLRATRAAQLPRQSNEALSDLNLTNSPILALSLRER